MKGTKKLLLLAVCLAMVTGAQLATPKKAEAVFPLSFTWYCWPNAGECEFNVTSTNHAMYKFTFGDSTSAGPSTSTYYYHDYNFTGSYKYYTVTLIGYNSNPAGSPDNIISCTIEAQGSSPGGNPGAFGTCS